MSLSEKILFVDDEPNMLAALQRELCDRYRIETAAGGQEGLEKLAGAGPYAVIVADYRMPRMDGIRFLNQVMHAAPDSVRIMLSGNADLQAAVDAVNHGQVFRFLTKPCPPDLLTQTLDAGLRQYQLVTAEKELLEKTLVESINMLTEVLSIVSPKAYGRSLRVRQLVGIIARRLSPAGAWQYEMAAALSQLGWIIFPPELLDKIELGKPLSADESLLYSRHPFTARKLLEKIPRLELIARIIERQNRAIDDLCLDASAGEQYFVDFGAHLLAVCVEYDKLILQGLSHDEAILHLYAQTNRYLPPVLATMSALKSARIDRRVYRIEEVAIEQLETGMTIVEPLRDTNGDILVEQNTPVTRALIVDLFRLAARPGFIVKRVKIIRAG